MKQPHITRSYIESLSTENARTLLQMLSAQYDEIAGEELSIADNVSINIDFAIEHLNNAEASGIVY